MAKSYNLTEIQIPERRSQSLYADIISDFIVQGAAIEDLLGGLALLVKLPVLLRVLVGRVEDGMLEETVVFSHRRAHSRRVCHHNHPCEGSSSIQLH